MFTDKMFIDGHKKAYGEATAVKVLKAIKDTIPDKKLADKVFLNEFGNEVHVNGPVVADLHEETLQERIARFDKLASQVAAIRLARAMGMIPNDDGPDEDVEDDSLLDDVEIRDDFGDVVEKVTIAEQKTSAADAAVQPTSAAAVSGDEPVAAVSKETSDVLSDD